MDTLPESIDLTGSAFVVDRPADILELVGQGITRAILLDRQLHPTFFDLSSGFAGELAQKCANYGIRLAIVAVPNSSWSTHFSRFADETTRRNDFVIVPTIEQARARLEG